MPAYKRKLKKLGERWRYAGSYAGQFYCSKAIYLTKKEAQDAEREKIREIDEKQRKGETNDMKLLDLVNYRLDFIKETKSNDYYKENRRYMKKLLDFFGTEILVSAIKKKDLIDLIELEARRLSKSGKKYFKVNAMIRSLKALFFYGIRRKDLEIRNPMIGVDMYSIPEIEKYIPSDDEIKSVREVLNDEQRALFDFVLETGARINEALRLEYNHIRENQIVLYTHKARNSNLTARIIPRPKCLDGIIGKGKDRVFGEWTSYPRFLAEAVNLCNPGGEAKWNWHNLRHRYASLLAKQGKPLIELMTLLGHTNVSTTQRYLHFLGFNYF